MKICCLFKNSCVSSYQFLGLAVVVGAVGHREGGVEAPVEDEEVEEEECPVEGKLLSNRIVIKVCL